MSKATVLVVDDEADLRRMLSFALDRHDFEVMTAESGEAALVLSRAHRFDVAVTDLKMPGMDGLQTLTALKLGDPDLEVIVATGYATIDTAVACMKQGAYDYIQKPFNMDEMLLLLDRALEKRHLRDSVELYKASQALVGTLDPQDVASKVVELSQGVLEADAVGLLLDTEGHRTWRHTDGAKLPMELVVELAASVTPEHPAMRVPQVAGQALSNHAAAAPFGSGLIYALAVGERRLGALVLLRGAAAPGFGAGELNHGRVFAAQAAIALENARLYHQLEEKLNELTATRDRLVRAEKLAVAGRFAAGVAHEVNNPLTFLQGNLEALLQSTTQVEKLWTSAQRAAKVLSTGPAPGPSLALELTDPDAGSAGFGAGLAQLSTLVENCLVGVSRIADLVTQLTRLSRSDANAARVPVHLDRIVADCVAEFMELHPGAIAEPHGNLGSTSPSLAVAADIHSALFHLLAFAVRRRRETPVELPPVEVALVAREGHACTEIVVPGLSLNADERVRLLEPRFDIDSRHGPRVVLDIGLTIAHQLLTNNAGELEVESTAHGGTLLRVSLLAPHGPAPMAKSGS